jgi:hypothetical protein
MFNTYSNKEDERSFFNSYKLKVYSPDIRFLNYKNVELITIKSDDFLGIRECNIAVLAVDDLIEIGAALALHKQVVTAGSVNFKHPMLKVFPTWSLAESYIYKMANSN